MTEVGRTCFPWRIWFGNDEPCLLWVLYIDLGRGAAIRGWVFNDFCIDKPWKLTPVLISHAPKAGLRPKHRSEAFHDTMKDFLHERQAFKVGDEIVKLAVK